MKELHELQESLTRLLGVSVMRDVLIERIRQQSVEGWTLEHDDQHVHYELSCAARCYAEQASGRAWLFGYPYGDVKYQSDAYPDKWPNKWPRGWSWKPKNPRSDLVRAAALIIAEIERLDRASELKAQALHPLHG